MGDYKVGGREKRGYFSSLPLGVKPPEQLFRLCSSFLQACPPWLGFSRWAQYLGLGDVSSFLPPLS